jgi:hypothetical protein
MLKQRQGKQYPADVLSKRLGYGAVWPFLQPLLFWKGDTANIDVEEAIL